MECVTADGEAKRRNAESGNAESRNVGHAFAWGVRGGAWEA